MSETASFSGTFGDAAFNLPVPLETSTLNRTPLVQKITDECLPPLVSKRI